MDRTLETVLLVEGPKLLLQFLGAVVVAWLTVRWALSRYKSEKAWDRRLTGYVEALTALSEMRLVVGRWSDELIGAREPGAAEAEAQRQRHRSAVLRLEEGVANATLLLPRDSAELLGSILRRLEEARHGRDQVDDLDRQYGILDEAVRELTHQGRRVLGVAVDAPNPRWPRLPWRGSGAPS